MTTRTNGTPKNATPVRLHLKPPAFPRLPFSSPIGEEILSPTSPKSRTPPQEQLGAKRPVKRSEEGRSMTQGLALDSVGRDGRERRKEGSPGRPGLNIVTTFPPRTSSAQKRPLDGNRTNPPKGKTAVESGTANPKVSDRSPGGHVRQASSKSLKSAGSRTRLDALRRGDSKGSNLSPGDRAVVIGISLPPDEVGEHAQSATTVGAEGDVGTGPQLETGKGPSKAPSIIVTPAGSIPPWSAVDEEKSSTPRPRARSSVYSQGPELANVIDSSIVPPVPALPPEVRNNKSGSKTTLERSPRVMSTCTVFDEEADPIMSAQPGSEQPQLRILKYASTETLATRPQSQGWWNNIMSPFWPKSPMHFKMPSYPNSPTLSRTDQDKIAIMKHEEESLVDEKGGSIRSGHTSWTDSPVPEEAEKPALTFDQILPSSDHSRSITALHSGNSHPDHAVIPRGLDNLGAAVEYFEACYHDSYESTPYFECQNHQCLPREFEANGIHADDLGQPQSRGLGLEGAGTQPPSREVETGDVMTSQVPTNRFSAAFREAKTPQRSERVRSEATIIEDLDETPDVHNAHIAPIVKAPEPISMAEPSKAVVDEDTSTNDPPRSRGVERGLPPPPVEAVEEEPVRKYRTPPPPPPPPPPVTATPEPIPEERPLKRAVAIFPPEPAQPKYEQPRSPPPPTPGAQTQGPGGALPLRELQTDADASRPTGNTYIVNHHYHRPRSGEQTSMADFFPPPRFKPYPTQAEADEVEKQERREQARKSKVKEKKTEKLVAKESKPTMLSKLKACCSPRKGTKKSENGKMTKKKKRLLWLLGAGLVAMILLIVLLAMLLHRRGDNMPVQTQWLNITGYPPIPTGVSTIIQPNAINEVSGCVDVPTMWSCALPKEQQQSFSSGSPDQPNFRVEIRFENGTNVTNSINSTSNNKRSNSVVNPVTATSFIRHRLLQLRSSLPSSLFSPSPPAPSQEDQTFLGNTTDGNHAPFDGEYTPFFMTFDSPAPLPSRLAKRTPTSTSTSSTPSTSANTTDPFPNLTSVIPPAATEPNGTASPATLYPLPSAQPLRLYNRGSPTEHYGFYTYFDKSIFLKSTLALNSSSSSSSSITSVPDDLNGGSSEDAAKLRCTWTQTRFLVQIWTNKPPHLLSSSNTTNPISSPSASSSSAPTSSSLANSSANDLSRPGSFPYPITLTLDRHGGDVRSKEIYCYALSNSEEPESGPGDKKLQLEDRGFKGTPVNPASGPFATNKVAVAEGGPGGVDGGSGGCGCVWQNFGG